MGSHHARAVLALTDESQITTTTPETVAIDLVSPQLGSMAGGTVVTLTGDGFAYLAEPTVPDILDVTTEDGDIIVTVARPHVSEGIENYAVSIDDGAWQPLDPPQAAPTLVLREQAPMEGTRTEVRLRAISVAGQSSTSASASVESP